MSARTVLVILAAATADMVLFNQGRFDVAIIFFGIGKPLPASLEQAATARVLSRAG